VSKTAAFEYYDGHLTKIQFAQLVPDVLAEIEGAALEGGKITLAA
jgi:hypothetical protein